MRRWIAERLEDLLLWLRQPEFPVKVLLVYVPAEKVKLKGSTTDGNHSKNDR